MLNGLVFAYHTRYINAGELFIYLNVSIGHAFLKLLGSAFKHLDPKYEKLIL